MNKNLLYRSIPKVDVLLEDEDIQKMIEHYSRETVMEAVHIEMDKLRKFIAGTEDGSCPVHHHTHIGRMHGRYGKLDMGQEPSFTRISGARLSVQST